MSAPMAVPFTSAEDAWLWTIGRLIARREGRCLPPNGMVEPDDVVKVLDRLYRQRRVDLQHTHTLRVWGERGYSPDARIPAERGDARLWAEAMERMEWPLIVNGIVQQKESA